MYPRCRLVCFSSIDLFLALAKQGAGQQRLPDRIVARLLVEPAALSVERGQSALVRVVALNADGAWSLVSLW